MSRLRYLRCVMNSSCSLKLLPFTEKCITTHQNYFSYIQSISNWHPSNISSPRHKKSSAKLCGKRLNRSRQRNKSICVHVHGSTPHHLHYALAEQYPIWNWYNTATAAAGFAVLLWKWINWTKQNLNCLLLLANVVFVQSLENCTVCTQHSLWLPNWIFYSVCFKSLVCLLKMDASCPWCKESSDKIQEKQKGKGSHLRYRVQKSEECVLQALQFISHTSYIEAAEAASMLGVLLCTYVCSMFSQGLIY